MHQIGGQVLSVEVRTDMLACWREWHEPVVWQLFIRSDKNSWSEAFLTKLLTNFHTLTVCSSVPSHHAVHKVTREVDNHNDWQTSCSSFAELVLCTQETSGTCVDTKLRGLESTSTVSAWCQEMTPRMLVIWSTKPWRWPVFICLFMLVCRGWPSWRGSSQ